jgi:DNA-binding GntR family transcriptional regulator
MDANWPTTGLSRGRATPDLIVEVLRADIDGGAIPPGAALRQEELARRFGVSRIPVRDALLRLGAEGRVVVQPNRGAYVSSLSAPEVGEIYDLRVLLEGDALERAVPRITVSDWARIEGARAALAGGARGPDWIALDRAFHLALYVPAGRPRQLAMIEHLRGTVDRYAIAYAALPSRTREWLADHEAILASCRRRDAPGARRLLVDHLRRAGRVVVRRLESASRAGAGRARSPRRASRHP